MSNSVSLDARAVRLVAAAVVLLALVSLLTPAAWLAALLAGDFVLRALFGPRLSPLARLAGALARRLGPPLPVSAAPKQFAALLGTLMTTAAAALLATGHVPVAQALLGTLALLASLEALLGFCLGCWLYGRLQAAGVIPPDACVDCRPDRG